MTFNSSNNFTVKETATITWSVTNFANQIGSILSPSFTTPSKRNVFTLKLFDCNDRVYIYLWSSVKDLTAQYRISILDSNDKKHFIREFTSDFRADNRAVVNYIHCAQVTYFLVNNTLKIHCEVDVLNEKPRKRKTPEDELEGSLAKTCGDYRKLLESGKLSDFVIVVGGKKLQVHKAILSARSAVFSAMVEHKNAKEVKEGQLVIKGDMSVEACEQMIRYIYCGEIDKLDEHAIELFVAADMYQLDHLKCICEQSLIESLSIESVCCILALADMHNSAKLKSKCIQFIIDNHAKVMATDGWKKLLDTNRMDLMAELFKICASQDKS